MVNQTKKYLKVDIAGQSQDLWQEMRFKLIDVINTFLDSTLDHQTNNSISDEAKEFTSALLNHAKEKLPKAGIENEKIIAEIDQLYIIKQKELAQTRKLNAESSEIEFSLALKKLKVSLGMTKALLIGESQKEDIIFVKQIESFIKVLNEFGSELQ